MKPIITSREIMLFTDTGFSKREFCHLSKNKKRPGVNSSAEEKACRAGMLFEMLPKLTNSLYVGCKAYKGDIHSADHFQLFNQGIESQPLENAFSLDSYYFLSVVRLN